MKTKRLLALVMIFAILFSLVSSIGVYAADVRMSINWFEQRFEEVVVVSIDAIITEDNRYSIEFSAPANPDAPQDLGQKETGGMLAFRNGEVSFKPDGSWIGNNQELADGNTVGAFEMNVMHNLKLKHTRRTGNVAIYVDNNYIGEYNMKTPVTYPINCATIIADSTITSGMELSIVSVIGSKEGGISAEISEHDEKNKTITVNLSETPQKSDFAQNVVLKNTNISAGAKTVPLSVTDIEGETIKFSYNENLDKATEYALIFPEGIEGNLGGKMLDRFYYITTAADVTVEKIEECTYDDGVVRVGLVIPAGISAVVDTDDEHKKAYNVPAYSNGGFQYIWYGQDGKDFDIPDEDIYTISFDIKPAQENIKMGIELRPTSGNPVSLAYGIDGYVLAMSGWTNDGWLNLTDVENTWAKSNLIGKYNTNDWITFKAEFNKTDKSITVCVNGEKKYTNTTFGELKEIAFHTPTSSNHTTGTSVMYLDNIVKEKISQPPTIKKARFYDVNGGVVGPLDTSDRLLERIELDFSAAMNGDTLNSDTISLTYNGERISFTGEYDAARLVYVMKPTKLIPSGGKVCLAVDGATDTQGEELKAYKTELDAYEGENSLQVCKTDIVNAEGNKFDTLSGTVYAQTLIANTSDTAKNVVISLMGYKDSALAQYDYVNVTLAGNTMYVTDIDINAINVDADTADSIMLSVNDADTGCPLAEAVHMEKTASQAGNYTISEATGLNKGAYVNIEVYAPEKTFADITSAADFRDVLIYKNQVAVGADGIITDSFSIDYNNAVSGMYKVCFYADEYEHSYEILYVNAQKKEKVFEETLKPVIDSNNTAGIADVIKQNHIDLGVDGKYIDDDTAEIAAELLLDYDKNGNVTADNIEVVLNKAVAIAAVNSGKLTDIIAEAERFDLQNSKLADLYEESFVTKKVCDNIMERMDNDYESIDDFYEDLYDSFILAVVENPAKPNSVKTVLKAFGITGSDSAYIEVGGKDYRTVSELEKAIENASEDKKDSKRPGGGSSGGGGGGGGSRVTVANTPVVSEKEEQTGNNSSEEAERFVDISGVAWAKEAILALADIGVVNGKESRKYYPTDNVTREEFTKMLVLAFEIVESDRSVIFDDVEEDAWYAGYVASAYNCGIVKGYSDDVFGVGENITREDMAVMLCRAADYKGIELSGSETVEFADDADISDYAKESVYAMKKSGIINGKDNNMFAPKDFANRAEAAKMIYGVAYR